MKCLTICQPWARAIFHGGKDVENRTRRTDHRGPLLIHAGASRRFLEDENPAEWPAHYGVAFPARDVLVFGAALGVVRVVDCVPQRPLGGVKSRWAEGPWCWILADARPFKTPIPLRGKMGLFDVPDGLVTDPTGWLMRGSN